MSVSHRKEIVADEAAIDKWCFGLNLRNFDNFVALLDLDYSIIVNGVAKA